MSFLHNFPYNNPRPVQEAVAEELGRTWSNYDTFIIAAPTALGKSAVGKCIANTVYSTSIITPTNMLVNQFLDEFPDTPTLHRQSFYRDIDDGDARWRSEFARARYRRGPGVYNYWIYAAYKLYRDCLVADEAHNLISMIQELAGTTIWQHDVGYATGITRDRSRMIRFLERIKGQYGRKKWWRYVWAAVTSERPQHVITETTGDWLGGGQYDADGNRVPRGEAVEMPCIQIRPVDVRDLPETRIILPRQTGKIVLMSATIGPKDVEQLGLDRGRVVYLNCESPIEAGRRPVLIRPLLSLNYQNLTAGTVRLMEHVMEEYLPLHVGEKGMIHVTYQQAEILRHLPALAGHPRLIFHGKEDKVLKFREFQDSDPAEGKVLVASGMYEGIDLPYDMARWQVVLKVPWLSLADPAIAYKSGEDPEWYDWETWKKIIQACGRVCRTPTDQGVTYILDGSIEKLYNRSSHLTPLWWREAVQWSDPSRPLAGSV